MHKKIISFFLLFAALLCVNSSFAASNGSSQLSHSISVHNQKHSQSTGKDFILTSDIQTERSNDEYKKRLALFRLLVGNNLLVGRLTTDLFYTSTLSFQFASHSDHLQSFALSHIYPFHFYW